MLFRLARASVDASKPVDAELVYQELLGGQLDPAARAWVLMVKGEAHRAQSDRDDARPPFELAQKGAPRSPAARKAACSGLSLQSILCSFSSRLVSYSHLPLPTLYSV